VGTPGEFIWYVELGSLLMVSSTDLILAYSFYLISMLFGLLGFLISLCVASTHAARLGARAGFSSALLFSGIYMITANAQVDSDTQVTVIAIGALFAMVGVVGLSAATRAWRRVRRSAISSAVVRSGYAVNL
jgi:uncharacterized membrane protein